MSGSRFENVRRRSGASACTSRSVGPSRGARAAGPGPAGRSSFENVSRRANVGLRLVEERREDLECLGQRLAAAARSASNSRPAVTTRSCSWRSSWVSAPNTTPVLRISACDGRALAVEHVEHVGAVVGERGQVAERVVEVLAAAARSPRRAPAASRGTRAACLRVERIEDLVELRRSASPASRRARRRRASCPRRAWPGVSST